MRLRRNHISGPLRALSVPLVATAVIAAGAGLHKPSDTDIPVRSEQIQLASTIDTAADALGVSESSLYYMSQSDLNTAMQQMQSLGITQVRVLLPWREMETADGVYSWTQADQLLSTAKSYGIAVDAVVTTTPTWATKYGGGLIPYGQPTSVADYASFVQAVASRYGSSNGTATGQISSIEVWNEPNGFTGWYPTPTAQGYTDLLKAAYTAIKSVAPGITVVGGVLGAGITLGNLTINPVTFLQQMYADGAAGYFDALSFHPYNYGAPFSTGTNVANSALQQLQALRSLMNANGDVAKLIWATEYGQASTTSGGEAQQAAYIQDFLNSWSTLTGVGPMFIYSLLDDPEGNNMGLFTDDWVAKAAAAVVKAWLAAHPTSNPAAGTPGSVLTGIGAAVQALVTAVTTAVKSLVSAISSALSNLLKALQPKTTSTTTAAAKAAAVGAASVEQAAAVEVSLAATAAKATDTDTKTGNAAAATETKTDGKTDTKSDTATTDTKSGTAATETKTDGKTDTDTKGTATGTSASASDSSVVEEKSDGGTKGAAASSTPTSGSSATKPSDDSTSGDSHPATPAGAASGAASGSGTSAGSSSAGSGSTGTSSGSSGSAGSASGSDTTSSSKGKKDKKGAKGTKNGDSNPSTKAGTGQQSSSAPSNSATSNHRNTGDSSHQPKRHSHS